MSLLEMIDHYCRRQVRQNGRQRASAVSKEHVYTSTACEHELHDLCRVTCNWCDAECRCFCHNDVMGMGT